MLSSQSNTVLFSGNKTTQTELVESDRSGQLATKSVVLSAFGDGATKEQQFIPFFSDAVIQVILTATHIQSTNCQQMLKIRQNCHQMTQTVWEVAITSGDRKKGAKRDKKTEVKTANHEQLMSTSVDTVD